jgi:hypothetical protein
MEETKTETREVYSDLPPVIQEIVDERNEFRLHLGRAMDVLKRDYPDLLRQTPGMLHKRRFGSVHESSRSIIANNSIPLQISVFITTRSLLSTLQVFN